MCPFTSLDLVETDTPLSSHPPPARWGQQGGAGRGQGVEGGAGGGEGGCCSEACYIMWMLRRRSSQSRKYELLSTSVLTPFGCRTHTDVLLCMWRVMSLGGLVT